MQNAENITIDFFAFFKSFSNGFSKSFSLNHPALSTSKLILFFGVDFGLSDNLKGPSLIISLISIILPFFEDQLLNFLK